MRLLPFASLIGAAAVAAVAVPLALASAAPRGELPVIAGAKGDRLPSATCADESWPYVSDACLPAVAPARVIAVSGENATVLVR
jgi:hypothetical protein